MTGIMCAILKILKSQRKLHQPPCVSKDLRDIKGYAPDNDIGH